MGSSSRLFNRQRTVHQILGGGLVADVVLWRQRNVSLGVMFIACLVWIVFERSGYTLLSLCSSVLLLLVTILFVWSKAASLLNRPVPPLPDVYLTKESVSEVAELVRANINSLIKVYRDVALGFVVLLTNPAIYEKYEEHIDACLNCIYRSLRRVYVKMEEYITMLTKLDIQKIQ